MRKKKDERIKVAIIVSITAVSILLSLGGFFIWRGKRGKSQSLQVVTSIDIKVYIILKSIDTLFVHNIMTLHNIYEGNGQEVDLELPIYDVETIAAATDSFFTNNKLGEGGFGPVYKVSVSTYMIVK